MGSPDRLDFFPGRFIDLHTPVQKTAHFRPVGENSLFVIIWPSVLLALTFDPASRLVGK